MTAAVRPGTLVIVPAYNEAETITGVVRALQAHPGAFDVVVVDDGSSDGTGTLARGAGAAVLRLHANMGNGVAVQTGLTYAVRHGYRFAAQFDADGQHIVDELLRLLEAARDHSVDVVVGSRFLGDRSFRPPPMRRVGIWLFSQLLRLVGGTVVRDSTSGLRVFNRRAMDVLVAHYPDHFPDADVLLQLALNGCRLSEVPVRMRERLAGRSKTDFRGSLYYPFRVSLGMLIALLRGRA
jgi:glycosyltransferase involved in cell wall biosynthesis